ncbi:MAG: DegT/DnrJ/EryC1/StrS aminotransferase family protein [Chloroflexi bacterium]|nr:MAG: DegT/DnrJ/EryC1/StrS aminotransferase family protein [Chloroflexota bacterium]
MRRRYQHEVLGYNFRMTDIQAAIGLVQLARLDDFNRRRIENASYFMEGLSEVDSLVLPTVKPGCVHVFHQFTLRVPKDRDGFQQRLASFGVGTGIYYPRPVHLQPSFRKFGYEGSFPVAEEACRQVISLPVHPLVSQEDRERIVNAVRNAVGR